MKKCKCLHTEDTLVIEKSRKIGNTIEVQKAVLTEFCKDCEVEREFFVMGGLLYNDLKL